MTEKELETRRWLNRAFYADKKVKALEEYIIQLRMHAEGVSHCREYSYTPSPKGSENGTESALARLLDAKEKYTRQIHELLDITDEISTAIDKLNDIDLETVLIHRYLLFHTIEETAELMNYSTRAVKYKHKKAVEKLCTFLPCFTP